MGWPGPMTHRQFKLWRVWLSAEWNRPSRSDHYVMRAAFETRLGNAGKKARDVKMEHMELRFIPKKQAQELEEPVQEMSDQEARAQASARSKMYWFGMMTSPVKKVQEGVG